MVHENLVMIVIKDPAVYSVTLSPEGPWTPKACFIFKNFIMNAAQNAIFIVMYKISCGLRTFFFDCWQCSNQMSCGKL